MHRHNIPDMSFYQGRQSSELLEEIEATLLALTAQDCDNVLLSHALSHHFSAGGQRMRALLCARIASDLGIERQTSIRLSVLCELLHNASLIHDDLQDGERSRRGADSVWAKFGTGLALCAGDYLISRAYHLAGQLDRETASGQALSTPIHSAIRQMIDGQCRVPGTVENIPDIDLYIRETVTAKGGALMALCCILPFTFQGYDEQTIALAEQAGLDVGAGYQLYDDLSDRNRDPAGSGNVIHILRQTHGGDDNAALTAGLDMAHNMLDQGAAAAQSLPEESGHALVALCSYFQSCLRGIS